MENDEDAVPMMGNNQSIRLLRLHQVLALIPVGKSFVWESVKKGNFPMPIKLAPRVTAWRAEDICNYINQQQTENNNERS